MRPRRSRTRSDAISARCVGSSRCSTRVSRRSSISPGTIRSWISRTGPGCARTSGPACRSMDCRTSSVGSTRSPSARPRSAASPFRNIGISSRWCAKRTKRRRRFRESSCNAGRGHRRREEGSIMVAIAAQPAPSPPVAEFLSRPPRLLIGAEWVEPLSDKTVPVFDPATGEQIATVADANAADVDRAVKAARQAFDGGPWRKLLPSQREALIWKLADLIEKYAGELAELESLDNGKTKFMASIVDIPGSRDYLRYMAGWA